MKGEELVERIEAWCSEHGATPDEIEEDEKGRYLEIETGDSGSPSDEGYTVYTRKVYLPKDL